MITKALDSSSPLIQRENPGKKRTSFCFLMKILKNYNRKCRKRKGEIENEVVLPREGEKEEQENQP